MGKDRKGAFDAIARAVLSVVLVCGLLPATAWGEPESVQDLAPEVQTLYATLYEGCHLVFHCEETPEGSYGTPSKNCSWSFHSTSSFAENERPWASVVSKITDVTIEDGFAPTSMSYWFKDTKLTEFHAGGLDATNLTSTNSMFRNCRTLAYVDFSGVETPALTYMGWMFSGCSGLKSVDLTSLDTSSVTVMSSLFNSCGSLTELDFSSFDGSALTDASYMLYGCSALKTIYATDAFDCSSAYLSGAFRNCFVLRGGNGSIYNPSFVDGDYARVDTPDAPGYFTDKTQLVYAVVYDDGELVFQDEPGEQEGRTASQVYQIHESGTTATPVWANNEAITSVSFECAIAPQSLAFFFRDCPGLERVDLSGLDMSQTTSTYYMFSNCSNLESVDLSGKQTPALTNMAFMFSACPKLKSVNLEGLDTSKVTNMMSLFNGCSSLGSVDISSFDSSSLRLMDNMFYGCSKLQTVYATSAFDGIKVSSSANAFRNCTALRGGEGTVCTNSYTGGGRARVDGGAKSPGYFTLTCLPGEHVEVPIEEGIAPTCTDEGVIEGTSCGVCGRLVRSQSVAPALGHAYGEATVEFNADHQTATATWACSRNCGHAVTAQGPVESKEELAATCFTNGKRVYTASITSADGNMTAQGSENETVAALGHDYQDGTCSRCGNVHADVNNNGTISIVDAQIAYDIARLHCYEDQEFYKAFCDSADVTGGDKGTPDGKVFAEDAWRIMNMVFGR